MQPRPLRDDRGVAEHGQLVDDGAAVDRDVLAEDDRGVQLHVGVDAAVRALPNPRRDLLPGDLEPHVAPQRVVVGLQVLLQVPDVGPVAVHDDAEQWAAVAQHLREEVAREVVRLAGLHVLEDDRIEDVDAGVDRVREDLAPRGLLEEARDPAVVVGHDDAELKWVGDAPQRDRGDRSLPPVVGEDRAQVHVGQGVAGDDDERLRSEECLGLFDGARRPERRVFDDVVHRDAEIRPVAEIGLDLVGHVVQRGDDLVDAVAAQEVDDVVHDRLAGDRRQRFRSRRRQRSQSRAFTARHHDRLHAAMFSACGANSVRRRPVAGR